MERYYTGDIVEKELIVIFSDIVVRGIVVETLCQYMCRTAIALDTLCIIT